MHAGKVYIPGVTRALNTECFPARGHAGAPHGRVRMHGMGPKVDSDALERVLAITKRRGAGHAVRAQLDTFATES